MAGPLDLSDLPTVDQALSLGVQQSAPTPSGPSGTGNLITSALGSGAYGALSELGSGAEAVARAAGFNSAADAAQAFAARQRAVANTYARPDLEDASFFSPSGFAYKMLQGLPQMAGVAGGAALATLGAPEELAVGALGLGARALLGGTAAAFPFAAGENIDRARAEGQTVDQGTAAKALALGVPLAAVQAALPVMGEGMLTKRIAAATVPKLFGSETLGARAVGAAAGAAVQAPAGAAGEAIMQQMGDPDRSFAQRSQDIVNAALAGGVQGAFFGGVLHSAAKKPPAAVSDNDLLRLTSEPLGLPSPSTPGVEKALQPPQRFPQAPEPPGGVPAGDVVIPPAQPGQAIRQLTDQTAPTLPGRPPFSGEVIQGRQLFQDEPAPPSTLPQLEPPQRFPPVDSGATNERVPRPASDDEPLVTPPPAGGDVTEQTNAELLSRLSEQGPDTDYGKRILAELQSRLQGVDPSKVDLREVLAQQDQDRAKAAVADQQTQQIKKVTRGFLPDFLKPHLGDDVALRGAIFDEAQARDAADKPIGSRLTAIAKSFGVMDDQGKLTDPRAAQEQNDTARAQSEADAAETTNLGPNPDVPTRVQREAIPEVHQPKWDALEALRKDAPMDFMAKIDDLQSKLAAPKRGEVGSIVKQTSDLRKAIEGQKAVDKVTGETPNPTPLPPSPIDETQGAEKFGQQTAPAKVDAEPAPVSKQDQLKAKQRGKSDAVQERSPAKVSLQEPSRGGEGVRGGNAEGQEATPKVEAPAGGEVAQAPRQEQIAPEHVSAIGKALKAVRGNIGDLMNQELPRRSRVEKGVVKQESDATYGKRKKGYDAAMGELDRAQAAVGKALKSGDPRELAKIGDDHFPTTAYDDFYDQLSPKGQRLLDEHTQKVDDLLTAVKNASTAHPRSGEAFSSHELTPHDRVIGGLIDQGKSLRDIVTHIARNGSNSIRRTMAAKLLQMSKADPAVRFGTMDEMAREHPTQRAVYGDYHSGTDTARIYDHADIEHTVLHEFTHAATVRAIENDPAIKVKADELLKVAKSQMTDEEVAHPAMANSAEMVAEAMSNPDFANLLDSMKGPGKTSLWQSIKDFVRQIFGLPKGSESLLDHVESLAGEASKAVNDMNTTEGMERITGLYARSAQDAADTIARKLDYGLNVKGVGPKLFRYSMFWRQLDGIATSMARYLPSLGRYVQNMRDLHNYTESWNSLVGLSHAMRVSLDKRGRAALDLLQSATFNNLDPRRSLDKHTWLTPEQRARLAPLHQKLAETWNQAKRGNAEVQKAYEAAHNTSRAQNFAIQVALGRDAVTRSGAKINLVDDPMARFQNDTSGMKNDPRRAADFWQTELKTLHDSVREYIEKTQKAIKAEPDEAKQKTMRDHLEDIKSWSADATRASVAETQAPNFPSRRFGDRYVSFDLAKGMTQQQANRFRQMLDEKGFDNVNIDHNIENNEGYIRVQGDSQAQALQDIVKAAEKEGLVKFKSSGQVANLRQPPGVMPSHLTRMIKAFRDAMPDLDENGPDGDRARAHNAAKNAQLEQMQQALFDILPDNSMSKLFAERENVQGMAKDMGPAFLDRGANTSRVLGQLFMNDRINAARKGLHDEVEAVKRDPNMKVADQDKIQTAANEAFLRDAQRSWRTEKSPFDGIRKMTHFFELGVSVPYGVTLASQVWTLGHGELTKYFGGVRSMQSLVKSHAMAFKIMKAAFQGADKLAFTLTPEKLKAAGIDGKTADFILRLNNMGAFNTSFTQYVYDGLHHHEGLWKNLHDISGAWTLYSEMMPRLVTALSARDLYNERAAQGKAPMSKDWSDVHSFANNVVNSSQFSWLPDLNPRAFGKQGVAGAASPLLAQFQGFRAKMLEKMARETADAFGARGPEYQAQARRFIASHLAAQTAIAGTMGLPFVGMFAGAYDALADWFSGTGARTHDIKASYRNWLSTVFGNTMGEALAHGAPRLGGVDLSGHLGEDRILPFTDMIASKKKLEDRYDDELRSVSGSAAHLVYNMALGARDMTQGDWLEGSIKILPEVFRNMAEAYQLGKYGYTDKAGFKYPGGPPSSKDVTEKALGFTPADEANYREKEDIASGIRERAQGDVQAIQTHLAKAFNRQDPASYAAWMQSSQNYMLAHPGEMPPAGSFGNYLREHMQSAALAGALHTPLGVSPRDLLTRGMVSYGNGNE